MTHQYGAQVASLGMAEKGSVNVKITVETPGGHSSVPPEHTGSEFTLAFLSSRVVLIDIQSGSCPSSSTTSSHTLSSPHSSLNRLTSNGSRACPTMHLASRQI